MRGLLLAAALLTGCLPAAHRQARKLEGRYTVGDPGAGWQAVKAGGADRAFHNTALGATIYTDSNCGPRFDEAHASILATELVAGLQDVQTLREAPLALAGRTGVLRVHTGTLDGVPMQLALGVLNRDACTYDFTLVAPPDRFDAAYPGYEQVVRGFEPS
jgi:hypothetical protein